MPPCVPPSLPKYGPPYPSSPLSSPSLARPSMDDLAHESLPFQSLSRKRKADGDECQVQDPSSSSDPSSVEPMLLDSSATPRCPTKASDHSSSTSWLLGDASQGMVPSWTQPTSVSPSSVALVSEAREEGPSRPKRPRIEIPHSNPPSPRRMRKMRLTYTPPTSATPSPRRYCRRSRAGETRDTGIVSATEPGPSRGSLLRTGVLTPASRSSSSVPVSPVDPSSPHIPSNQPPINRDTLKELNLEAILRNPQLRHDLLFDSGLQFRPTSSRRKRELADIYWLAIIRELECGCTCVTLDSSSRPCERVCICGPFPIPTGKSIVAYPAPNNLTTIRAASRIRPLLMELLAVLESIIQPVTSRSSGLYMQPDLQHPQFQQHTAHIALLKSVLDADLIQQEIEHGLFDPSGVFQTIGDIIRCHCAPMRDNAVDQMVTLAKSCAPGGNGSRVDAVRAIRLCFEILELMKLDVANHQLQTLRPYLVQSAAQYELQTFQEGRQKGQLSLDVTREWLQSAYQEVATRTETSGLTSNPVYNFAKIARWTQIHIAVTKAIVNLIFDPPPSSPSTSYSLALSSTHRTPPITSFPGYPETLYLDQARLVTLSTDAADYTALYMLLMLYRQLVYSGSSSQTDGSNRQLKADELLRLKKEIWEIGPPHLGYCFLHGRKSQEASDRAEGQDKDLEWKKWCEEIDDVVLQVTMRASDAQSRPPVPSSSTASHPAPAVDHGPSRTPDEQMVKLASCWAESNLRHDSPLSMLMRKRIRDQVQEIAVQIVVPALKKSEPHDNTGISEDAGTTNGLEPLMPEIRHLAERLAKVASIHLNVYGALYAQPGFLADSE
ncbi:Tcp11-domain-containing protein [Amylocystis lapponica]|nr:Tcp11-domain-containing protein [Amylocystis lapponica]